MYEIAARRTRVTRQTQRYKFGHTSVRMFTLRRPCRGARVIVIPHVCSTGRD